MLPCFGYSLLLLIARCLWNSWGWLSDCKEMNQNKHCQLFSCTRRTVFSVTWFSSHGALDWLSKGRLGFYLNSCSCLWYGQLPRFCCQLHTCLFHSTWNG